MLIRITRLEAVFESYEAATTLIQSIQALTLSVNGLTALITSSNANYATLTLSVNGLTALVNRRLPTKPPRHNASVSAVTMRVKQ